MPDENTVINLRRLLERHVLGDTVFEVIGMHLKSQALNLPLGSILDASIVSSLRSTTNSEHPAYPKTHSTKRGCWRHIGMRVYLDVDEETGLTYSVGMMPATGWVSRCRGALHGGERRAGERNLARASRRWLRSSTWPLCEVTPTIRFDD